METRAGTTTSITGFTTPGWLQDKAVVYKKSPPSVLAQIPQLDLPEVGVQLNIPDFTAGAAVLAQTETAGVTETDPTSSDIAQAVVTDAGQVVVSQQFYDRGLDQLGATGDAIIRNQLLEELHAYQDKALITQLLAGITSANTVTDTNTYSASQMWTDLALAASKTLTTSGVMQLPNATVMPALTYSQLVAQSDNQNRPIFTPLATDGGTNPVLGQTGYVGPAGRIYWSSNIPTSSSGYAQTLVFNNQTVAAFLGELIYDAIPETFAGNLSVLLRVRQYRAFVVFYPLASVVITGSTYPASPTV